MLKQVGSEGHWEILTPEFIAHRRAMDSSGGSGIGVGAGSDAMDTAPDAEMMEFAPNATVDSAASAAMDIDRDPVPAGTSGNGVPDSN